MGGVREQGRELFAEMPGRRFGSVVAFGSGFACAIARGRSGRQAAITGGDPTGISERPRNSHGSLHKNWSGNTTLRYCSHTFLKVVVAGTGPLLVLQSSRGQ